jgi:SAM-dependent MidA family methyltransferase
LSVDGIDSPSSIYSPKGSIMQQEQQLSLPEPDAESVAHSARVAVFLREQIAAAGGQISFAEYMHHALYAPRLGYYSAGAAKFGPSGDFVTAPEVSPVFGRVLARQCASILSEIESPSILEFGAGSGRLAVDVLRKLSDFDALPERYLVLEVSADLRERQEDLLRREVPDLIDRVAWIDRLPDEHRGVVIANEVLDALPVERFVRHGDDILQICVADDGGKFVPREIKAPDVLANAVLGIEDNLGGRFADGYVSEVSLAMPPWIRGISQLLRQGTVFLFDYGLSQREYYEAERSDGWLRCHFRHHAHNDPFILPGIQDLTAWVDFSAVASAAVDNGLEVAGYVTQAHFLVGGGLDAELADFSDLPIDAQLKLSGQVKLLTLPGEMGENFKCLGLSRGVTEQLDAFSFADRTTSL